jgi:hypothetical protein
MQLARSPQGWLWHALYAVCFAFVVSFILFEALDIDGSNLQVAATSSPSAAGQSLGEDRVDDLHVYATTAFQKGIVRLEAAIGAERIGDGPDPGVLMSRHNHLALPRASLSPPPPLA